MAYPKTLNAKRRHQPTPRSAERNRGSWTPFHSSSLGEVLTAAACAGLTGCYGGPSAPTGGGEQGEPAESGPGSAPGRAQVAEAAEAAGDGCILRWEAGQHVTLLVWFRIVKATTDRNVRCGPAAWTSATNELLHTSSRPGCWTSVRPHHHQHWGAAPRV